MNYTENCKKVEGVKLAYIGGGSRGWAREFMSDLAAEEAISGTVYLYDIDYSAAKDNEKIGQMYSALDDAKSRWQYKAVKTLEEALKDADFVVISILPGTFDEMQSDVHTPEKYGIYQTVGDTTGPGGIVRALRSVPMFKVIAEGVRDYCPNAWVINYTNPMAICVDALYRYFPEIKAFGCCHEVFATQYLMGWAYNEKYGKILSRDEVKVNVVGINHFTWLTSAKYGEQDLYPMYTEFVDKYYEKGFECQDKNWLNAKFSGGKGQRVKFDLFKRYGVIAAAGDRHLVEFCPRDWYLHDPYHVPDSDCVRLEDWKVVLTSVKYRKEDLLDRIKKTKKILAGEEKVKIEYTGEEGVQQMKAILGLAPITTNMNMPNRGQIPNLPNGIVVETNAVFDKDSVVPVNAGSIPKGIDNLVQRVAYNQSLTVDAAVTGDYELAFKAFINDPLVNLSVADARKLFDEMLENTKAYLPDYERYKATRR